MTHPHLYIQAMSLSLLKPDVVYVLQTKKTQRKFKLTDALSEKNTTYTFFNQSRRNEIFLTTEVKSLNQVHN